MMSTLTTFVKYSTGSPHSKGTKWKKSREIREKERKLLLFIDDIIVYVKNHEESTKKIIEMSSAMSQAMIQTHKNQLYPIY